MPDYGVLTAIFSELVENTHTGMPSMESLWEEISKTVELLKSVQWSEIPEEGLALNGDVFASMNFAETENLKFKPTLVSETLQGL